MNLAAESTAFMFGLYIAKEINPFALEAKESGLRFLRSLNMCSFCLSPVGH